MSLEDSPIRSFQLFFFNFKDAYGDYEIEEYQLKTQEPSKFLTIFKTLIIPNCIIASIIIIYIFAGFFFFGMNILFRKNFFKLKIFCSCNTKEINCDFH
jgi:hypothetical protein